MSIFQSPQNSELILADFHSYQEIRDLMISALCNALRYDSGVHTDLFREKVRLYGKGELQHCSRTFVELSDRFIATSLTKTSPSLSSRCELIFS